MSTITPGRAYATVTGSTATFTAPDGRTAPITPLDEEDVRAAILRHARDESRRAATPLLLVTAGDRGAHHLLIHPDGTVTPTTDTSALSADARTRRGTAPTEEPGDEVLVPEPESLAAAARPAPTAVLDDVPAPVRASFIAPPSLDDGPRRVSGWRSWFARMNGSAARQATEDRETAVAQHWAGCRTVAVVNGKGGVGKTMTTAMLAAVFARYGGGNVLAWDNNDTRGTLGWRTDQGRYDTTLRDLLPAADMLLSPTAGVSDITRYVHHQPADRYDVLRSNPELLATDQRIAGPDFDLLLQVAARYYRMVIFDSGNDESADRWLRMVDSSYQLVLPTLATPESAESAALLLDALRDRDERSRALAANAVVVVSQAEPTRPAHLHRIVDGFDGQVRDVVVIPFDPALKSGPLRFDALQTRTKHAWVSAAAVTARDL